MGQDIRPTYFLPNISDAVNQIEDRDTLKLLHRRAIRCASLEEFKRSLDKEI